MNFTRVVTSRTTTINYYYWFFMFDWKNEVTFIALTWVARTVLPLAILIGVPGNLCIFFVFLRKSCGLSKSARLFYAGIAAMDFLQLMFQHLPEFLGMAIPSLSGAKWLPQGNSVLCKLTRYVWLGSECTSRWILVIFCFQRILVIRYPLLMKSVDSVKLAAVPVAIVTLYAFSLATIAWFMFAAYQVQGWMCGPYSYPDLFSQLYDVYYYTAVWTPVVLDIISVIIMVISLRSATQARAKLGQQVNKSTSASILQAAVTLSIVTGVNTCFYVFNAYFYVEARFLRHISVFGLSFFSAGNFGLLTIYLWVIPHSILFLILIARMAMLRTEILRLLHCSGENLAQSWRSTAILDSARKTIA